MLEPLEILDGAILLTVYATLMLFVPLAFFGLAAGLVATVLRIPLSLVPGLRAERGVHPHPVVWVMRTIVAGLIPFAIGAGALLVALDRVVGDNSTDPIVAIAIGAREGLFLLLRVQDAGLRAWTGLAPVEVLARMGAVDGPRSLAVFTQLVGAHLASQAQVPAETFRSAFAIAVAVIAALAVGLSPLRGLRAARRTARESAQRLARYDARESDA